MPQPLCWPMLIVRSRISNWQLNRETYRILSRPVGIRWAGWRSNTLELQQAGWEIAVEFYQMDFTYRLMLHHKALDLHAVSNQQLLGSIDNITHDISKVPYFEVVYVARSLHSVRVPELDFNNFQTIDARPMYTKMEIQRVEDMNVFNVKGKQEQVL